MRRFGEQQQSTVKYTVPIEKLSLEAREAIARRERKIIKLVNAWTRLRLLQNQPPALLTLNELINERFEVADGLDALAFNRIDDLTQEFETKIKQLKTPRDKSIADSLE